LKGAYFRDNTVIGTLKGETPILKVTDCTHNACDLALYPEREDDLHACTCTKYPAKAGAPNMAVFSLLCSSSTLFRIIQFTRQKCQSIVYSVFSTRLKTTLQGH
jgi:hypothetical protein